MASQLRTIALILARGGSKGVPRKNVRLVGGKPLIAWTIEAVLASRWVQRVILSTDDEEIAATARTYGCEVPFMRPPELARDESSGSDVCEHALRWLEAHGDRCDYFLVLQPTSPLRTTADIDGAVQMVVERRAPALMSVSEAASHPYLARRMGAGGTLADFLPIAKPERRQDFPPAYCVNGAIYIATRDAVLEEHTFEPPGTLAYVMPSERSIDVDTPWDLHLVDLILGARNAAVPTAN